MCPTKRITMCITDTTICNVNSLPLGKPFPTGMVSTTPRRQGLPGGNCSATPFEHLRNDLGRSQGRPKGARTIVGAEIFSLRLYLFLLPKDIPSLDSAWSSHAVYLYMCVCINHAVAMSVLRYCPLCYGLRKHGATGAQGHCVVLIPIASRAKTIS